MRDGKQVVLVADRNKAWRETLEAILRHNGFEVVLAADGEELVVSTPLNMPDVIVTGLHLDKIAAGKACPTLKRHPATSAIPIILMTGMEGVEPKNFPWASSFVEKNGGGGVEQLLFEIRRILQ